MSDNRKVIAVAVQALRVEGVWALHEDGNIGHLAITHVPTGRKAHRAYIGDAERVLAALVAKLPRFAESAAFGSEPDDVAMTTLRAVIAGVR